MKKINLKLILGLALGLPSTILGVFWLTYELHRRKIISENLGLLIMVLVVVNTLYLMIRYGLAKKNN